MRLWTLHPKYLDAKGLVALWREALLAQKVLAGRTRGYRHHSKLARFQACEDARSAAAYLRHVHTEAWRRGYHCDARKIGRRLFTGTIPTTTDQLAYELRHLRRKLFVRDRSRHRMLASSRRVQSHPLFRIRRGAVEAREVVP